MEWVAIGILGTAALVATGFLAGYIYSGSSAGASGIIGDNPTTCDDFCKAWQGARLDTCAAVNALASAQAFADTLAKAAGAAALAAAVAAAIALAGGWIPFLGPTLVAASITAAATAFTAAMAAAGAGTAALQRGNELASARAAENTAKLNVFAHCSGAALTNCLAMPAPC